MLQSQKKEIGRLNDVIIQLRADLENSRKETYEINNRVQLLHHFRYFRIEACVSGRLRAAGAHSERLGWPRVAPGNARRGGQLVACADRREGHAHLQTARRGPRELGEGVQVFDSCALSHQCSYNRTYIECPLSLIRNANIDLDWASNVKYCSLM